MIRSAPPASANLGRDPSSGATSNYWGLRFCLSMKPSYDFISGNSHFLLFLLFQHFEQQLGRFICEFRIVDVIIQFHHRDIPGQVLFDRFKARLVCVWIPKLILLTIQHRDSFQRKKYFNRSFGSIRRSGNSFTNFSVFLFIGSKEGDVRIPFIKFSTLVSLWDRVFAPKIRHVDTTGYKNRSEFRLPLQPCNDWGPRQKLHRRLNQQARWW